MKAINLKLTGFESYCKPVEIDFTKVSRNGLFLICGSTGSGKTTIFDAITYALFGEASGENRKESSLRSTLADENIPTKVEFTFEVNSKVYTVKRNPKYLRKSKTGNKTVTENANAELIFHDGREPVVQTSKVTACIEEILKLCKKDFCQIAMIAQGAFQKFLLAPTEEKKNIFREIFKTSKYQKLEEKLDAEAKELLLSCKEINNQIIHSISLIDVYNNEELLQKLNQIKEKSFPEENDINTLEEVCKNNSQLLKENENQIKEVQEILSQINSKATRADEKRKLILQKEKLSLEIKNAEEESLLAEKNLSSLLLKEDEKKSFQEKLTLIKNSIEEYTQLDNEENLIKKLNEKNAELLENQNFLKENILKNKNIILQKKERLLTLKDSYENLILTEKDFEENSNKYEKLQSIKNKLSSFLQLQNLLNKKQEETKKAAADYEEKNSLYLNKKKLFFMEQAGILAEELSDGKACPVCGSLSHPEPAKKSGHAPSKEELEALEKEAGNSNKYLSKISNESSQLLATLLNEEKNLKELASKEIEDFNDKIESLKELLLQKEEDVNKKLLLLRQSLSTAKKEAEEKDILQKEIPLLEEKLSQSENELSKNLIDFEKCKTQLEEKISFIENLKSKLIFSSKSQAEKNMLLLENAINEIEKNIEFAKEKKDKANTKKAEFAGQLKQTEELLETYKDINEEEVLKIKNELEEKNYLLNQNHNSLLPVEESGRRNLESVKKLFNSIKDIEKKRQMVSNLSNIANGNISSSGKVRLETYVQAAFFDRIIARANKRFLTMSSRQFELVRDISTENHRSQIGLDLNVIDHHNGSIRSVTTLSGGEQFQASLSLALGLSDEIQETSGGGGIHLDSMFIDEGFGSLDSSTLNKAMNSLMTLAKNEKLIGIISHVEELKSRIDSKIIVTKDINGNSSITIEN